METAPATGWRGKAADMDNLLGWLLLVAVTLGVGAVAVNNAEGVVQTLSGTITNFGSP